MTARKFLRNNGRMSIRAVFNCYRKERGFEPGLIYDFWYPATDPKILGIGFAATRDLVSFLRYQTHDAEGAPNPVALNEAEVGIRAVLAFGNSQSGRYLRHHTSLGFNQDEQQRKVFDGVLTNVAGIGKVFTNTPFGQPYRTGTQHEDHFRSDGLLAASCEMSTQQSLEK